MDILLSLVFSKGGALILAIVGILSALGLSNWRRKRAESRANRAEASLAGAQLTQEAHEASKKVDEEVKREDQKIEQELGDGDLDALKDRLNNPDN